ncbi:aquaporin-9-like [Ornithodoros turicata]|uniref:aquaporin-9-like n=1 Tax=Ornithodoros turicata TaxID=34597 RepID=UPI003139ABD1
MRGPSLLYLQSVQETRAMNMHIRSLLVRELINEFIGTMLLILIGDSIMAILIAGRQEHNAHVIGPIGWGTAIFCAVFVAGGVSAHINPAVTLAFASVKEFPVRKVPLFWLAQYLGAFVGAVLVYVIYRDAINLFDGGVRSVVGPTGTAPIFSTYPREGVSTLTCFFDQVISTGVLTLTVAAIVDERNFHVPKPLLPLMFGILIIAEIFAFSYNCMAPLNPARDIGPRIFTAIAGWGSEVFSFRNYQWVWVPIFGPHIGGIVGIWIYKLCIRDHWPAETTPQVISSTSNGDNGGKIVDKDQSNI